MNRSERRLFKKKLGKQLGNTADKIIQWTKQYEGVDDKKLEELISEEIKTLDFNQLMLLMEYVDNNSIHHK